MGRQPPDRRVLVVAVAVEGHLGATPGKPVNWIAVVGESDARLLGLVRTFLRWLAHVVDTEDDRHERGRHYTHHRDRSLQGTRPPLPSGMADL